MFRLTRQVRFAVNDVADAHLAGRPTNAYAGFPSLAGLGHYFELEVSLVAPLDGRSQYVRNIVEVDAAVRRAAVPAVERHVRGRTFGGGGNVVRELFNLLRGAWPGATLASLQLNLSPFLSLAVNRDDQKSEEARVVRLSQTFEFSAAHRLHNPALDDAANRDTFGKCNNPLGHGHNYQVRVTLAGEPGPDGVLVSVPAFERAVAEAVIDRFDHKFLNVEVPEFREMIPSVENIARVAYGLLKPRFADGRARMASVTVWETPKTWCEYSE